MNDAMYLLPFLAAFVLIFLDILSSSKQGWKPIFLKSVIFFSAILVLITETLSAFHAIDRPSILVAWTLVSVLVFLHMRSRFTVGWQRLTQGFGNLTTNIRRSHPLEKAVMALLVILVSMTAVQGVIYPVNNHDSLTYHMPRIVSWINQESVEHYRTSIYRQLYQPPFSEFFNLHVILLLGGDMLCNSLQLFFLLSCVVAVAALLDQIGIAGHLKLVSAALVLTIPIALLQSSNNKSDIILAFFVLTAFIHSLTCIKNGRRGDYLLLGLSFGLAMLTKGTSPIYLAPLIPTLAFTALRRVVREKSPAVLIHAVLAGLLFLAINAGHQSRNYRLTENVLGLDASESKLVSNEKMTPKYLLSNILKNIGRQVGPAPLNKYYDKLLLRLHRSLDMPLDNPYTHFQNIPYSGAPSKSNYEENAPNYMHLLAFLASIALLGYHAWVMKRDTSPAALWLLGTILLQFVLFSALLKWQPWHSRLLVAFFILTVPFVCHVVGLYITNRALSSALAVPFILLGMYVVAFNRTRPLNITKPSVREVFLAGRFSRQFMGSDRQLFHEYKVVREAMSPVKDLQLGIIVDQSNFIYTVLRDTYDSSIHPIYLNAENPSRTIASPSIRPTCIVTNKIRSAGLGLRGAWYENATPANKIIWLYRLTDTAYRR